MATRDSKRQRVDDNTAVHGGYIVFDAETDGLPTSERTTPRISCVATQVVRIVPHGRSGGVRVVAEEPRAWHSPDLGTECYMTEADLHYLVQYLYEQWTTAGLRPLGWNSLSFDWRTVYELLESAVDRERVRELVGIHVDPMFNFFMCTGYPVGLKRVAQAFRTPQKTGTGAAAAKAWATGTAEDRTGVVRYCCDDVRATTAVVECIHKKGAIEYIEGSGHRASVVSPYVLATVDAALQLQVPKRGKGCRAPMKRSQFAGWYEKLAIA
jgi:hypothetical protein